MVTCTRYAGCLALVLACLTATTQSVPLGEDQQCKKKADLLFLIDGSGSIGSGNFTILKGFIANLSSQFAVGYNAFLMGAITFNSVANLEFDFDDFPNNAGVREALLSIDYYGGLTDTASALRLAKEEAFTPAHGARDDASRVVVVLTDGISNNESDTVARATLLKKSGANIFVIGITNSVRQSELQAIASSPNNVFNVGSFALLDAIWRQVADSACNGSVKPAPTPAPTPVPVATAQCVSSSCDGRRNGDYPACFPECKKGSFISCSNGQLLTRPCPLGRYSFRNGTTFTAPMVYNAATYTCELTVNSCPRNPEDYLVIPPPETLPPQVNYKGECLNGINPKSCVGKVNGNYPFCHPDCKNGDYITCSNDIRYVMPCGLGWYTDSNGQAFTAKTVYNPSKGYCELETDYCPRLVTKDIPATTPRPTTTLTTTVATSNWSEWGDYSACSATCGNGIQTRSRQCLPAGAKCVGSSSERSTCDTKFPCTLIPPCISATNVSCVGVKDGFYTACGDQCHQGIYFRCAKNSARKLGCDYIKVVRPDGSVYYPIGVYEPVLQLCQEKSSTCPVVLV